MNIIYYILAVLCGVSNAVQGGVNSELRKTVNNPILAAIISFVVGLVSLIIIYPIFNKNELPALTTLKAMEWWKWVGGMLGAYFVLTVIMSIQKIGSANMLSLIIGGQLFTAILLDRFGLFGFQQHSMNGWRIGGGVLIILGVWTVMKH